MKKLTLALLFFLGYFTVSEAQVAPPTTKTETNQVPRKKNVKSDKTDKEAKMHEKSTGITKSGAPDMRMKENKKPKVVPQPQPPIITHTQPTAPPAKSNVTHTAINPKVPDKAISTDAKGRTIYEGPRGGRYYIDKNGHKEYISKDKY